MHLNTFIHDLVDNTSFRKWVLSDFEADDDIWSAFIDEHENNQDDINDAIRLVLELDKSQQNIPPFSSEETWSKIQKTAGIPEAKTLSEGSLIIRMTIKRLAVAAVFIGVVACAWLMTRSENTEVFSGSAEMIVHQLPDGSRVTLNRKSEITYNPEKWKDNREIRLNGEAFFEVKKGSDFKVITSEGEVQVLGTSFNVHSRDRIFAVTCYTGKVAVKNSSDNVSLLPGQEVVQDELGNLDMLSATLSDKKSPWLNNFIRFHNASLERVVHDLVIYYGDIFTIAPDALNKEFTGILPSDNQLKAIENLTWALGLKYKISKEGQYHIYR